MTDVVGAGLRMLVEKCLAGDDESGSAEAALRSIVLNECLLYRMQLAGFHQRFDGGAGLVLALDGEHRAGIDRLVIHQHGTSAAFGAVTNAFGPG